MLNALKHLKSPDVLEPQTEMNHMPIEDKLRLAGQAVQRLFDDVAAAKVKMDRSKQEAARCMADPAAVLPQELQLALVTEREAGAAYAAAVEKHRVAVNTLENQKSEIRDKHAREDVKAKNKAYEAAISVYRMQCAALIPAAIEVRRLAALAGVFTAPWESGDLLFDLDSDIFVMGHPLPVWNRL